MKLICIGDSLTFGYGVRPSQRWTRLCAQETGWEIVNEGISGDTTGGMLVRLRALLADRDICVQRPLVLLMGGANDIFFSGTDTGARANMGAMLNQLLSTGIHTMIGVPTPICAENVSSQVLALKQADPDAILCDSYIGDATLFVQTLKEQNYAFTDPKGVYADLTTGGGGHSLELAKRLDGGRLIGSKFICQEVFPL